MAVFKQKSKIQRKTEVLQSTLTSPGGLIPMQWGLGEDTFNIVVRNSDENSYTTNIFYGSISLAATASPSTSGASLIGVSAISGVGAAADLQTTLQNFKTYIDSLSYITTLPATQGGTGLSSYNTGDLLYASSPTTLTTLPAGLNGQILKMVGGVPSWQNGGGGGEVNTASNLGSGVGLFNGKVGVDLQFNSLIGGTGISIFYTDVTLTSYTIAVDEGALTLDNIGGILGISKGGTGLGFVGSFGQVLRVNNTSTGLIYDNLNFTDLADVPSTYVDPFSTKHKNRIVKVNSARTGLEFGPYTNKGTFNVSVRNGFDNSVVNASVPIKWEKFGSWIFLSIGGFSGTLGGASTTNLILTGSYPTEFNVGSFTGSSYASMRYGGVVNMVNVSAFTTEIRIYVLDTSGSPITPGLVNFDEFSTVFNTNSTLGF
jgi:hypothetical protein